MNGLAILLDQPTKRQSLLIPIKVKLNTSLINTFLSVTKCKVRIPCLMQKNLCKTNSKNNECHALFYIDIYSFEQLPSRVRIYYIIGGLKNAFKVVFIN